MTSHFDLNSAAASSSRLINSVSEASEDDLEVLRYLLDLALQPLDQFAGFTRMEQIGSSALRYQLNFISYALAMSQFTRTPAFSGYLAEAQRNCIVKMCDRCVWRYWAWENLVGNLRWNPDPIVYQNVMYSGFFGVMIGLYESLNADKTFSETGSLMLRWSEKLAFEYDFSKLTAAIQRNMQESRFIQFPCEPHLVYPMCNSFALNTLIMHDRLHRSNFTGDLVDRVRESYQRDRFLRADGRFCSGRGPLRLAFPPFVGNDAVMAFWLHAVMPEQSQRSWRLIREHLTKFEEGEVKFGKRLINKIDFGNYSRNDAWMRSFLMALGREMGDQDYADAIENSFNQHFLVERSNGARMFKGVSTWANANYALARFGRENAMQELILGGIPDEWKSGPLLAQVAYPEVLVAKAVTDGKGLDLVLRPGNGPCRTKIAIGRLIPNVLYRVTGVMPSQIRAGASGEIVLEIDLTDRSEITIHPVDLV